MSNQVELADVVREAFELGAKSSTDKEEVIIILTEKVYLQAQVAELSGTVSQLMKEVKRLDEENQLLKAKG